jgi:hypothetical protein
MAITKELLPGVLNNGFISGWSSVPIKATTPVPINNSAPIKKGRRAGNTILNHVFIPLDAASKDSFGNNTINSTKIIDRQAVA